MVWRDKNLIELSCPVHSYLRSILTQTRRLWLNLWEIKLGHGIKKKWRSYGAISIFFDVFCLKDWCFWGHVGASMLNNWWCPYCVEEIFTLGRSAKGMWWWYSWWRKEEMLRLKDMQSQVFWLTMKKQEHLLQMDLVKSANYFGLLLMEHFCFTLFRKSSPLHSIANVSKGFLQEAEAL